jgi:hypothetical protein
MQQLQFHTIPNFNINNNFIHINDFSFLTFMPLPVRNWKFYSCVVLLLRSTTLVPAREFMICL